MIICFSGTGNSRHVADRLQDILGDELVRLAPGIMKQPENAVLSVEDKRLIWVFPVHSWGLPERVLETMKKARIESAEPVKHFCVCTCGDDIGYTDQQWRSMLRSRGWQGYSAFSVQMPNVYTFLPEFDVDPKAVEQQKLDAVKARVEKIAEQIVADNDCVDVARGSFPWMKSKVLYPLFKRFLGTARYFHHTADCDGCGRCSRNCPLSNIAMVDKRPQWGKTCTMCSRCYQCCPRHAVAYGAFTKGKGQYLCPGYSIKN